MNRNILHMPRNTNLPVSQSEAARQAGLTKILLVIIIVMFLLAYFKVDVRGFVENVPFIKEAAITIWGWVFVVWNEYLSGPLTYFWDTIVIDFFWEGIIEKVITKS